MLNLTVSLVLQGSVQCNARPLRRPSAKQTVACSAQICKTTLIFAAPATRHVPLTPTTGDHFCISDSACLSTQCQVDCWRSPSLNEERRQPLISDHCKSFANVACSFFSAMCKRGRVIGCTSQRLNWKTLPYNSMRVNNVSPSTNCLQPFRHCPTLSFHSALPLSWVLSWTLYACGDPVRGMPHEVVVGPQAKGAA